MAHQTDDRGERGCENGLYGEEDFGNGLDDDLGSGGILIKGKAIVSFIIKRARSNRFAGPQVVVLRSGFALGAALRSQPLGETFGVRQGSTEGKPWPRARSIEQLSVYNLLLNRKNLFIMMIM